MFGLYANHSLLKIYKLTSLTDMGYHLAISSASQQRQRIHYHWPYLVHIKFTKHTHTRAHAHTYQTTVYAGIEVDVVHKSSPKIQVWNVSLR